LPYLYNKDLNAFLKDLNLNTGLVNILVLKGINIITLDSLSKVLKLLFKVIKTASFLGLMRLFYSFKEYLLKLRIIIIKVSILYLINRISIRVLMLIKGYSGIFYLRLRGKELRPLYLDNKGYNSFIFFICEDLWSTDLLGRKSGLYPRYDPLNRGNRGPGVA
jgi:hypothetical protein